MSDDSAPRAADLAVLIEQMMAILAGRPGAPERIRLRAGAYEVEIAWDCDPPASEPPGDAPSYHGRHLRGVDLG